MCLRKVYTKRYAVRNRAKEHFSRCSDGGRESLMHKAEKDGDEKLKYILQLRKSMPVYWHQSCRLSRFNLLIKAEREKERLAHESVNSVFDKFCEKIILPQLKLERRTILLQKLYQAFSNGFCGKHDVQPVSLRSFRSRLLKKFPELQILRVKGRISGKSFIVTFHPDTEECRSIRSALTPAGDVNLEWTDGEHCDTCAVEDSQEGETVTRETIPQLPADKYGAANDTGDNEADCVHTDEIDDHCDDCDNDDPATPAPSSNETTLKPSIETNQTAGCETSQAASSQTMQASPCDITLDRSVYDHWCSIKTAEGLEVDTELAQLFICLYESQEMAGRTPRCICCQTARALYCSRCQNGRRQTDRHGQMESKQKPVVSAVHRPSCASVHCRENDTLSFAMRVAGSSENGFDPFVLTPPSALSRGGRCEHKEVNPSPKTDNKMTKTDLDLDAGVQGSPGSPNSSDLPDDDDNYSDDAVDNFTDEETDISNIGRQSLVETATSKVDQMTSTNTASSAAQQDEMHFTIPGGKRSSDPRQILQNHTQAGTSLQTCDPGVSENAGGTSVIQFPTENCTSQKTLSFERVKHAPRVLADCVVLLEPLDPDLLNPARTRLTNKSNSELLKAASRGQNSEEVSPGDRACCSAATVLSSVRGRRRRRRGGRGRKRIEVRSKIEELDKTAAKETSDADASEASFAAVLPDVCDPQGSSTQVSGRQLRRKAKEAARIFSPEDVYAEGGDDCDDPEWFGCSSGVSGYLSRRRKKSSYPGKNHTLSCSVCFESLPTWLMYKSHMKTHLENRHCYACDDCDLLFSTEAAFKKHKKETHKTQNPKEPTFKCDMCRHKFFTEGQLVRHMKTHEPVVCSYCGKTFSSHYALKAHVVNHTGEKPHVCDRCGKGFGSSRSLQVHMVNKHALRDKATFVCDICGAAFIQKGMLRWHKKSHLKKSHDCEFCNAKFSNHTALKAHRDTEHGKKPFQCDSCHFSFELPSLLAEHRRSHTGEKLYSCQVCGTAFARRDYLKKHKMVHTEEKPYACQHCDTGFLTKMLLTRHIRSDCCAKKATCTLTSPDTNKSDMELKTACSVLESPSLTDESSRTVASMFDGPSLNPFGITAASSQLNGEEYGSEWIDTLLLSLPSAQLRGGQCEQMRVNNAPPQTMHTDSDLQLDAQTTANLFPEGALIIDLLAPHDTLLSSDP